MNELISKRRLEEALICGLCRSEKTDDYKNGLWDALRIAEDIEPVNAVELPCKVGDTVYKIIVDCGWEGSLMCPFAGGYGCPRCKGRFEGKCKAYIETIQFNLIHLSSIGKSIFLTYGEAEKALEELRNE